MAGVLVMLWRRAAAAQHADFQSCLCILYFKRFDVIVLWSALPSVCCFWLYSKNKLDSTAQKNLFCPVPPADRITLCPRYSPPCQMVIGHHNTARVADWVSLLSFLACDVCSDVLASAPLLMTFNNPLISTTKMCQTDMGQLGEVLPLLNTSSTYNNPGQPKILQCLNEAVIKPLLKSVFKVYFEMSQWL